MSLEHHPAKSVRRHRRAEASAYLKAVWNLSYTPRTLAKMAVTGGGPPMTYIGRFPYYEEPRLDEFAVGKIGPTVASTSERPRQLAA